MKPMSIVAAGIGGVFGAAIWASIVYLTHMEIGYVAWAVGGLVGLGSYLLGGSGTANGVSCAAIAILSILAGKYVGLRCSVEDALAKEEVKLHAELLGDAEDFAALRSEDQYREFMVTHRYTSKKSARNVTDEELEEFKENRADMLRRLSTDRPTFKEWRASEDGEAMIAGMRAGVDIGKMVVADLNAIEIIFAILGIGTAFRIGSAGRKRPPAADRAADPTAGAADGGAGEPTSEDRRISDAVEKDLQEMDR